MGNDEVLQRIEEKLAQMLRLIALQSTREMKQTQAIEFLNASGFERKLIADILNTTSNNVSVSLSKSKAKKKSPTSRGKDKSQMKRRTQTNI
jgi:hypothetical protein